MANALPGPSPVPRPRRRRLAALALAGALGGALGVALPGGAGAAPEGAPGGRAQVKVQLRGVAETVDIERLADGSLRYALHLDDGGVLYLSPQQFAARVYDEESRRPWWAKLLNITSAAGIAWVVLGLLGQVLFTGRMLVQWLHSERHRRSVVPAAFWWLSLVGATMLLVYFVWRRDIVGVLGQAFGWVIYVRNLWLIHLHRPPGPTT
jgi:lipid-A-disaccharide synthase-like uncharacterized protein